MIQFVPVVLSTLTLCSALLISPISASESNYMNLTIDGNSVITLRRGDRHAQWIANVVAHPTAEVSWFNPNGKRMMTGEKYELSRDGDTSKVEIYDVSIEDSGLYVLQADNSVFKQSLNVTLLVEDEPKVKLPMETYYLKDTANEMRCLVLSYPSATIEWVYNDCSNYPACNPQENQLENQSVIAMPDGVRATSVVTLVANQTRRLTCRARNSLGTMSASAMFFVTDVVDGFSLWGPENAVSSDDLKLTCGASKYHYKNDVSWSYSSEDGPFSTELVNASLPGLSIQDSASMYSYWSTVEIKNITKDLSGYFTCHSSLLYNVDIRRISLHVKVKDLAAPYFTQVTNLNGGLLDVDPEQKVIFYCFVDGFPTPDIVWFKDGISLDVTEDSPYVLKNESQVLEIKSAKTDTVGRYACEVTNRAGDIKAEKTIQLFVSKSKSLVIAVVGGVIGFIVIVSGVIVFFWLRIRNRNILEERKFVEERKDEPTLFEPNLLSNIRQYSRAQIKLGKKLGSGAFGEVVKAKKFGLKNGDIGETVAVKTVRKNFDTETIKNLASELKILAHIGKHINIVNLIGACTENSREPLVIVEYCKFGNLRDYLYNHKALYINQVNSTGDITPLSSDDMLRRQDSQSNSYHKSVSSYYSVTSSSKLTDSTPTTPTTPIAGDDGYLLPLDMDSNKDDYYQGDYKASSVKSIYTQDLISWAFQIANGMDYLASKKVMHGDLAARNVLLAENNIVKICDFGLSKNLYEDTNYLKKGGDKMPVKWLSIEALKYKTFSTQSDVWSYGIVLWEIFSLGMTPYPGLRCNEEFLKKLEDGYRMESPIYCPNTVYKLMLECWNAEPSKRPSFAGCSIKIDNLLDFSVREQYIRLNDAYLNLDGINAENNDNLYSPTFGTMTARSNSVGVPEPLYDQVPNNPRRVDAADHFELESMLPI